jgi:hypothetical protein
MALIPPRITPPWERPGQPAQPIEPPVLERQDIKTRFQPGVSGNPSGRAPGTKNRKTLLEQSLADAAPDVQAKVVALALEGDMQAASLVMTRVHPPLRPRAERVQFELDPSKPLFDQAQQVLVAVAAGDIDPETGQMLVNLISSFAGIRQVDDLLVRIQALEQHRR